MRIENVQLNKISNISYKGRFFPKKLFSLKHDVFEKRQVKEVKKQPYDTTDDYAYYKSLSQIERASRYEKIGARTRAAAQDCIKAAKLLTDDLDKKYGKDGYTFVSLGTSPAGIAKAMELMGRHVKYVPISNLKNLSDDSKECWEKGSQIGRYLNFLHSIDLSKEDIEHSDKKYIIADYTFTGTSLKEVKNFIENSRKIKPKNIEYLSINNRLKELSLGDFEDEDFAGFFENYYLNYSRMEEFVGIPHMDVNNVGVSEELFEEDSVYQRTAKNFTFALAYELDRKRLLKKV